MQKISTVGRSGSRIFKGRRLTIGVDLGDRWSWYCVLDEAGEIVLEHRVTTTQEAMKQVFGKLPRSRIALETGAHSPWVSRLLTALGHEVIVAHARNVRLIGESRRKDDRIDARTLARPAGREKRQETSGDSSGAKANGSAASVVARGRGLRTPAQ